MKKSRRAVLKGLSAGVAGAYLAGSAGVAAQEAKAGQQGAAKRPKQRITSQQKFDPSSIAPYAGDHRAVYQHIDQNLKEHIGHLQRWIKQPSVSALNHGIREMAQMLRDDLRGLGFKDAELVPTKGHPGVWGHHDAGAKNTLVVYMMYDVQPVEPSDWKTPPFAAELAQTELGTVLRGRGAVNQKGPQRAFLNAVSAILATDGKLPVNLMVVAEGEEEQGSPNFPEVIAKYESRLRGATGALFPFPSQDPTGAAELSLGVKGILYMHFESVGGAHGGPTRAEIHGSLKAIADSPTWRMVQALASLTSPDGNTIRVPGYYDAIRPPNEEEQALFASVLANWDDPTARKELGVQRWIDGMTPEEAAAEMAFNTTLNVDGLWSGYTGEGTKTILPHKANAKVDSRLVPNQKPEEAVKLIRAHLDAQGFTDVKITKWDGYPPAQTSVKSALVQSGIAVMNKRKLKVSVAPRIGGSAPYYVFTDRLKLPILPFGLGHGSGAHAPNEYLVIEPTQDSKVAGLAEIEKGYVDLLYALGG